MRELLPPGTQVVTVLRDPVERCLSHVKHQIDHERRTGEGCGETDVNAFIELPGNRFFLATLRDLSVKYLCYRGHPNTPVEAQDLSLERALEHGRRSWVGFADALEAFEARIAESLLGGAPTGPGGVTANRSPDRTTVAQLSRGNRDRLRALNDLDLRLYEGLRELELRGELRAPVE